MSKRTPEDSSSGRRSSSGLEESEPGPAADEPLDGRAGTPSTPPRQRLSRHPPPALHRRPAVVWGAVALAALFLGLLFFGDVLYRNALVVRPRAEPSATPIVTGATDAASD